MTSHGDLVHRETFWLADQDDVRHLLSDLRVFGYAERLIAEEEALEIGTDRSIIYEVRIRRHILDNGR